MKRGPLRRIALAGVICLGLACSHAWQRVEPEPPVAIEPRQQFQVWMDGEQVTWHALRITDSSLSGVPFTRRPECDSCRREVLRTRIDSIRIGDRILEPFGLMLLGATVAMGFGLFAR